MKYLIILCLALTACQRDFGSPDPDIKMEIPAEPPKSQTVLLGNFVSGMYRTLDLETGIVCYYPTGSGVGINCFQFEEGPAETPTAHQLARM